MDVKHKTIIISSFPLFLINRSGLVLQRWLILIVFNWLSLNKQFDTAHDKTYKMAYVPSEDSDQPGHPTSLISAVGMKKAWVFSYQLSTQQRLIRLGGYPGWSESSLGAHAILLVLSCAGSFFFFFFFFFFCRLFWDHLLSLMSTRHLKDRTLTWDYSVKVYMIMIIHVPS